MYVNQYVTLLILQIFIFYASTYSALFLFCVKLQEYKIMEIASTNIFIKLTDNSLLHVWQIKAKWNWKKLYCTKVSNREPWLFTLSTRHFFYWNPNTSSKACDFLLLHFLNVIEAPTIFVKTKLFIIYIIKFLKQ